ncbi:serine/threonine-protein kinase [Aspergillus clavatus NRRL 1]|uniref:Protein kinase, putative n=1 Tax=Aspergillus clavatus (strain ATCC 1007 / CBS 513.65 / DSM 816 / NCTC 3887 / NRRL 1 / QM 1276 / 107) TaxID=344612 RepID=A1CPT2_ASPCL|nr:protein kinase, putative [Aspergillus clavatus NRRL 1]EAW07653.1 protein kinase, putative [Aspergillus clavatus NRRL 1]
MAHKERNILAGLKIETSFQRHRWQGHEGGRRGTEDRNGIEGDRTNIFHDSGARRCGTDEDNSVLSGLHSATPPISVPRHDDHPAPDTSYPHKPEDVQASPLDSYTHNRRPSISFDPTVSVDSGQQQPLEEPLARGEATNRAPFKYQSKSSGLRNALSQEDNEEHRTKPVEYGSSPRRYRNQHGFPTGPRGSFPASPEEEAPMGSELERPTSLTSVSTVSPVTDEVRTPPESSRDLLSPIYMASPVHTFASLDDRSSWSGSVMTPFGSKPRGLRGSTRQSSRRSTLSSGKSPASMFLSMWSSREEPAPEPDDEGQMVGTDYVLGKQIGFGGFSTVKEAYKVEERGGTRRLAVKIVRKQVFGKTENENDMVQAEFDHEVRVWRYLNHPNILTLDAVYETDYATFCFTKLAIGGTLFDLVRQNRQGLDIALAKKYTYQLGCALRYLHEDARVVHKDIKLENCLLDPIGSSDGSGSSNLVLCDFGMAEWLNTDNEGDSPGPYGDAADRPAPKNIGPAGSSTSVAGSLEYASPELLLSINGVIDPSVDIWAFGVIIYTMIVGSRPFQDAFAPRIQQNILNGTWDRKAILGPEDDSPNRQDREAALELIQGCLDMDVGRRWNIREALSSRWLHGVSENVQDGANESIWKL